MMCPRNWGPASFQLRRAPSARSAKRPLRVPIQSMLDMKEGSSPRCRVVNGAHRPGGETLSRCAPVNSAGIASRGPPAQRMLRRLSTRPHSGRRGFHRASVPQSDAGGAAAWRSHADRVQRRERARAAAGGAAAARAACRRRGFRGARARVRDLHAAGVPGGGHLPRGRDLDLQLANIDGMLRDYSPEALQKEDARLGEFRARFAALAPATLSARRRVDRSVALAQIAFLVHQHEVRRHQLRSLDSYTDEPVRGVDWQIQGMSATGPATRGTDREWRAAIARVRAVPAYLATARRQLAAGVAAHRTPDWRMLSAFGLESTAADAEYFGSTLGQIAAANVGTVHRDTLLHELQAAGSQAAEAYRRLRDFVADTFFENPRASGVAALKSEYRADRFALGESEYDWALRNNLHLTGTAAKLFEASWPVVEETRNEMITLAQQIAAAHKWPAGGAGPETVRAVFAQLTQNAPRTDAEMMEGYRRTGERLVEYARRTGLFDVPADYRLEVTETPPPLRASIEGGAYYPAPPFKKSGVGRVYVSPTGDDATELREYDKYAASADLAAHE